MKRKVKKKLFNLMTGELAAVIMFAVLWLLYIQIFDWAMEYLTSTPNIAAFLLLEFILIQGSLYWYLKWRRVRKGLDSKLPDQELLIFLWFKRINLMLFLLVLFVFIYHSTQTLNVSLFFIFLYIFALIEYINYFHIRLSYLSAEEIKELKRQKGLRRSILAKELRYYIERKGDL